MSDILRQFSSSEQVSPSKCAGPSAEENSWTTSADADYIMFVTASQHTHVQPTSVPSPEPGVRSYMELLTTKEQVNSMDETISVISSAMKDTETVTEANVCQDITVPRQEDWLLPGSSEAVVQCLTLLSCPEVQLFAKNMVDHLTQTRTANYFQNDMDLQSTSPVSQNSFDPETTETNRHPSHSTPTSFKHHGHFAEEYTPAKVPAEPPKTPLPAIRRSPRKLANKQSEGSCKDLQTDLPGTQVHNKVQSPKTPIATRIWNQPGCESSKTTDSQLLLKDCPSVFVEPSELNKAISVACKAQRPGYKLCYRLLRCVFSTEELALSRGQGLTKPKKGDLRPALDKTRVETVKDYASRWCQKNYREMPSATESNNAVTEQVSHCKKLMKSTNELSQ